MPSAPTDRLLREVTFGSFLAAGSDITTDVLAGAGFDWLLVDLEHGAGDEPALRCQVAVLRAHGIPALVRVESPDRIRIGRALDLGADGVMVPRVDSVNTARAVATAARFTPDGTRGVATSTRAARYGRIPVAGLGGSGQPLMIVQVESTDAIAQVDGIAGVEGIDCLFVGPADLSSSLGIPGDVRHDRMRDALHRVLEATSAHGRLAGIMAGSPDDARRYLDMGFRLVALSSDVLILAGAARQLLAEARTPIPSGSMS